jgi:hypothetical protein
MKFVIVSLFLFSSLSYAGVSMRSSHQVSVSKKTTHCQMKQKKTNKTQKVKTHHFIKI